MKHPVAATSMSIQNYLKVSVFFFFFFKREGCLRGGRPQHGAGGRVTEDTWHVPRTPREVAGRVGRRLAALIRSFVDFHQLPKLRI